MCNNYSINANCESPLDVSEDLDEVVEAEDESSVGPDVQRCVAHPLVGGVRKVDDAQVHDVALLVVVLVVLMADTTAVFNPRLLRKN